MTKKWQIVDVNRDNVVNEFDTEEKALEAVEQGPPKDFLGSVVWTIRPVWRN